MIVTIDGPAGSGKSTAAKTLAARLGFEYLDTGAMFRAVGLALLRRGIDPADGERIPPVLPDLRLDMPPGRVFLNGEDITPLIRTPEVSSAASKVAVHPAVRRFLAAQQRAVAAGRDMVCEGRDQGTAVFPDAFRKFFLTADPRARAERRWRELLARGDPVSFEEVLHAQEERDRRDASRDLAPMVPAPDAVILDTTRLAIEQVIDRLEQEVRRCLPG